MVLDHMAISPFPVLCKCRNVLNKHRRLRSPAQLIKESKESNTLNILIFKRRQVASIGPNVCRSVGLSVCLSVEFFLKIKRIKKSKDSNLIYWLQDACKI